MLTPIFIPELQRWQI